LGFNGTAAQIGYIAILITMLQFSKRNLPRKLKILCVGNIENEAITLNNSSIRYL